VALVLLVFDRLSFFLFLSPGCPRDPHSFPTRRSSDLLVRNGLTPRLAVLALYALAALFSLGSLLILRSVANLIAMVAVLAGVFAWFLTSQLQYEELSELNLYVARAMNSQRRVLANQILIRKASRQVE